MKIGQEELHLPDLSGSPWDWPDWSADETQAVGAAFLLNRPEDPLYQYAAVRRVLAQRAAVEEGEGLAILNCMRICAAHDLLVPPWLLKAFDRGYFAVATGRVGSWDDPESFGKPYPKLHLQTVRLRRDFGFRVQMLFSGPYALPRTQKGRQQAADALGLTEKQVRPLLPTTRTNKRGHRPYSPGTPIDPEMSWHALFGKKPK